MLFRHKSASCPLSYFPPSCGRKLGNEFLVVAAHGAFDSFVSLKSLQRFLTCTIVRIAKNLCKLFRSEFIR